MRQRLMTCILSVAALGIVPAMGGEKPETKRMTCHWSSGPLFYSGLPQPAPLLTVEIEIDPRLQKVTELYKNSDGSGLLNNPANTSLFKSLGELISPFITTFGEEYVDGRKTDLAEKSFTESVAISENRWTWSRSGTSGKDLSYRRNFSVDTLSGEYKEDFQTNDSGVGPSHGVAIFKCALEP